jgi:flagellin-like hook-associated protein FlgL
MRDAVRQAVIDARTPTATTRWIQLAPGPTSEADIEEAVARSKADILAEAAQAMLAQANQTRESVTSLLQAPD